MHMQHQLRNRILTSEICVCESAFATTTGVTEKSALYVYIGPFPKATNLTEQSGICLCINAFATSTELTEKSESCLCIKAFATTSSPTEQTNSVAYILHAFAITTTGLTGNLYIYLCIGALLT